MKENLSIEDVTESVKKLYVWSFRKAREIDREEIDQEQADYYHYEAGKLDGMNDACAAILLQLIGGKELFELWTGLLEEDE